MQIIEWHAQAMSLGMWLGTALVELSTAEGLECSHLGSFSKDRGPKED